MIDGFDFYGQKSDWSNIQKLNISETSELTENETSQMPQSIAIIGTVVAIVVVSAGLLVYFRKRKH